MARRLPPLGSLRAFEAAARHLSFARAADELGVTPTAVSHQIRSLEDQLGEKLFVRRARAVSLTPAGEKLYPSLRRSFDAMADAVAEAVEKPARRVATLSATVAFTAKILVPRAARFREANPGWDLRLHASDDAVDLAAGEADAAIRYGLGRDGSLARLPLMTDRFSPVASPRLALSSPDDLRSAALIHFDWRPHGGATVPSWREWGEAAGLGDLGEAPGVVFNDENSAILAAVAGQGVALLSLALVKAELQSGVLAPPFDLALDGWRYDFVHMPGEEDKPAVAALKSWILSELGSGVD